MKKRRVSADLDSPLVPDDIRRRDQAKPEPIPAPVPLPDDGDFPLNAASPPPDGGVDQHPVHDEDLDDLDPEDYEEQVDELEHALSSSPKGRRRDGRE